MDRARWDWTLRANGFRSSSRSLITAAMMDDLGGLGGTFWATLIGAIVGAVVGGIITFLIQINGVRIARNERPEAKLQDDLATALSAMVKIIKLLSNIGHIRS